MCWRLIDRFSNQCLHCIIPDNVRRFILLLAVNHCYPQGHLENSESLVQKRRMVSAVNEPNRKLGAWELAEGHCYWSYVLMPPRPWSTWSYDTPWHWSPRSICPLCFPHSAVMAITLIMLLTLIGEVAWSTSFLILFDFKYSLLCYSRKNHPASHLIIADSNCYLIGLILIVPLRRISIAILVILFIVWVAVDTAKEPERLMSLLGLLIFTLIGFLFSKHRSQVRVSSVAWLPQLCKFFRSRNIEALTFCCKTLF